MINKRFFKTKDEVEVTFEWPKDGVESIEVLGDFNQWEATPMKLNKRTKSFKFKTRLPKDSKFQFRYRINQETWINEPAADEFVANEFGEENCVLSTYSS